MSVLAMKSSSGGSACAPWPSAFAVPLAVLIVGFGAMLSNDQSRTTLPILLLFYLVWVGTMTGVFLFKTALRAWLCMGSAILAGYSVLYFLKTIGVLRVVP